MKLKLTIFSILFIFSTEAQVKLPSLIRDSMILQRDVPLNIWGWASPGENIKIKFANKSFKTKTSPDGKWKLSLPSMKAGGPYTMNITASNTITLKEILIGDVWLCSGQSNMVHQMALHRERYENEIAQANYPNIRQFWVPNVTHLQSPQEDIPASYWKSANPNDVLQFSAVAYFFAKVIYDKYKIPIGLINASWGGSPIEAWTSEEGLKEFPAVINTIQKNKDTGYINNNNREVIAYNASRPRPKDKGLPDAVTSNASWFKPWYDVSYEPKGWRTITVPGYWEDQGVRNLDGIIYFLNTLHELRQGFQRLFRPWSQAKATCESL